MKKIKKILTIGLAGLLMLCMSISLVGCKPIEHNAVIITDGIRYQEEWLKENHVYGAYDENLVEKYLKQKMGGFCEKSYRFLKIGSGYISCVAYLRGICRG